ncbi:MAG: DUF2378 family protein [Bacteroidales bacterium]|nr:DUF2378 family protein [Bacteroidales bacterium]
MEVKGTAVKTIGEYVKKNYPSKYDEWLKSMPEESRSLFEKGILTNQWYPVREAAIVPTKRICDMFFGGMLEGAWQSGRYSAQVALTGIYKLYVMMSKPAHIIERASRVFSAYYSDSDISVTNKTSNSVDFIISEFPQPNEVIENRIAGWIEAALELSGCKNVTVNIAESKAKGQRRTVMNLSWN